MQFRIILLLLLLTKSLFGSIIVLKNGDKIRGKIIAQDLKNVRIKTLIGTLTIEKMKIRSIEIERATTEYVIVYLKNKLMVEGWVIDNKPDVIILKTKLGALSIIKKGIARMQWEKREQEPVKKTHPIIKTPSDRKKGDIGKKEPTAIKTTLPDKKKPEIRKMNDKKKPQKAVDTKSSGDRQKDGKNRTTNVKTKTAVNKKTGIKKISDKQKPTGTKKIVIKRRTPPEKTATKQNQPEDKSSKITFRQFPPDVGLQSMWRSALLPSWGQFSQGKTTKGAVIAGLAGAGLAGTLISYTKYRSARNIWETTPTRDNHDAVSKWGKSYNTFLLFSLSVWAYNVADALIFAPKGTERQSPVTFSPIYINNNTGVVFHARF